MANNPGEATSDEFLEQIFGFSLRGVRRVHCLPLSTPLKIWAPTNPQGVEGLPLGIVVAESDLYLRILWGLPNEALREKSTIIQILKQENEGLVQFTATDEDSTSSGGSNVLKSWAILA